MLAKGLAYGRRRGTSAKCRVSREVLKTMDLKDRRRNKRLVDCLAPFSDAKHAATSGRDAGAAAALRGAALKMSYYHVEYLPSDGRRRRRGRTIDVPPSIPGASRANPTAVDSRTWGGLVNSHTAIRSRAAPDRPG